MSWREATSFIDPTYGQRSVFGAGDATTKEDDDLDVQDEEEALEYLRLVREEASKIPTVMIARQHGPRLYPPQMVQAAVEGLQKLKKKQKQKAQKKRRKQRRHWDDLDDGPSTKKRRLAGQAPAELSYEEPEEEEEEDGEIQEEEPEEMEDEMEEMEDEEEMDEPEDEEAAMAEAAQAIYDRALYQPVRDDALGFYEDGAYTAAPEAPEAPDKAATSTTTQADVTALFRTHLLARFAALRAQLQQDPPAAARAAKLPTSVGSLHNKSGAFARWLLLLQTTDPQPAQMAAMDRVSAFRLVRVLLQGLQVGASQSSRSSRSGRYARWVSGGGRMSRGLQVNRRTSRWLWAVLARLPARGELGYAEMGDIRELAKEAVLRLAHLSYDMEGEGGEQEGEEDVKEGEEGGEEDEKEGEERGEDGEERGEEGEREGDEGQEGQKGVEDGPQEEDGTGDYNLDDMAMDAASEPEETETTETTESAESTEAKTDPQDDKMHQRATLEMVLVVAGEFYGQRDLLAFRSPWPEDRRAESEAQGP